jgi:nucleolar protein 16
MGRELQKKKNRSSNPKVSRHKNPRSFKIKSFGNEIIKSNWYVVLIFPTIAPTC